MQTPPTSPIYKTFKSKIISYAKWYLELGLIPIPATIQISEKPDKEFDKKPLGKKWHLTTRTTALQKIQDAISEFGLMRYRGVCGLALLTGKAGNISVIDVDLYKLSDNNRYLWDDFSKELSGNDTTTPPLINHTINGGLHYIYKYTQKLGKSRGYFGFIDVKNDGGCIVVAPTCNPNNPENCYKFDDDTVLTLQDVPKKLIQFIDPKKSSNFNITRKNNNTSSHKEIDPDADFFYMNEINIENLEILLNNLPKNYAVDYDRWISITESIRVLCHGNTKEIQEEKNKYGINGVNPHQKNSMKMKIVTNGIQ